MALEDELSDILKKSRHGQGLSAEQVAQKAAVPPAEVTALEQGERPSHRDRLAAVARALGLRPDPLAAIALDNWNPVPTPNIAGIETVRGEIGGYEVKGYIVHDQGQAVLVDTAYNAPAMLERLAALNVKVVGICLTHGHVDHAGGIDQVLAQYQVPVYLGDGDEPLLEWHPPKGTLVTPRDGQAIQVGGLSLQCVMTPGHTPGGICYRIDRNTQPVCFVGDTLFAGSIGRSNPASLYPTHLASVRNRVLTLPEHTVLFPGHGPSTTVREERSQNPFAASA
ncbi:MAG: MBL fold metallo-hydrolase [Nitrospiraceae bacterium]